MRYDTSELHAEIKELSAENKRLRKQDQHREKIWKKRVAELEAESSKHYDFWQKQKIQNQELEADKRVMKTVITELQADLAEVIAMTPVMRSLFKWKKMEAKHTALVDGLRELIVELEGHASCDYLSKEVIYTLSMAKDMILALLGKENEDG